MAQLPTMQHKGVEWIIDAKLKEFRQADNPHQRIAFGADEAERLFDELARIYVEGGGGECPLCESADVDYANVEIDGTRAYQRTTCRECGAVWHDGYTLDSVLFEEPERRGGDFYYPGTEEVGVASGMPPRVLIVVEGGMVSNVMADAPVLVRVKDFDNISDGGAADYLADGFCEPDETVTTEALDAATLADVPTEG